VLADGINQFCGVTPADFADMTDGIASSSCRLPVRDFGEIVSVFGHEHEIGKSFRMTLNQGQPDEKILLDIPDWSFDWQYNYYPAEPITLKPGDNVLLECTWDRSRRSPDLEPAYVLWADGTNDEMCFGTIATRISAPRATQEDSAADDAVALPAISVPPALAECLEQAGISVNQLPSREQIDPFVDALFTCAEPQEVGDLLTSVIAENFGGLIGEAGISCLADGLANLDAARQLLIYGLDDSTEDERRPIGELVGDCVLLTDGLEQFGFPIPETAKDCINEGGRELLVQATIDQSIPEEQTLFGVLNPCLAGG